MDAKTEMLLEQMSIITDEPLAELKKNWELTPWGQRIKLRKKMIQYIKSYNKRLSSTLLGLKPQIDSNEVSDSCDEFVESGDKIEI